MKPTKAQMKSKMEQINRLACKLSEVSNKFESMMEDYYGEENYSDHDCDEIIDSLDYGHGIITFEDFDRIMREINSNQEEE